MTQFTSYEDLLWAVLHYGEVRTDRTGTGTRSLFAPDPLVFDLSGMKVPLITSKAVPWKMALREFLWMLSGSTDVNELAKSSPQMAGIWKAWANPAGQIGPTYGAQWRDAGGSLLQIEPPSWGDPYGQPVGTYGVDQLTEVVKRLVEAPDTRRAVVSLWSVPELRDMALEPCMVLFQFSLRGPNYDRLELHVYQRSADMMLGVPFDLFQAGFLAHAVARELTLITGRQVRAGRLVWSAGDVHVYENQVAPAELQLEQWRTAEPMRATIGIGPFPSLRLLDGSLEAGHVTVQNYNPAGVIDAGKPAV
jgi:thymidylate synthase